MCLQITSETFQVRIKIIENVFIQFKTGPTGKRNVAVYSLLDNTGEASESRIFTGIEMKCLN